MKKNKLVILLVLVLTMMISSSVNVLAHTLEIVGGSVDEYSRFQLMASGAHMGTSSTNFVFNPANAEWDYGYGSNVNSASYSWAGYISVTKNDLSSNEIIRTYYAYGTAYASAEGCSSTPHDTSWWIQIYYNYFDSLTSTQKSRVLAHEMGHIFGLRHTGYTTEIMYQTYQSSMPSPQTQDKWGIRNCTGNHSSHSFSSKEDYGSSTYHKYRCSICKGYKYELHNMVDGECTECGYVQ